MLRAIIASLLFLAVPAPASDALTVGNPGGTCTVMDKGEFIVCHSATYKIPLWTAEHLTRGSFGAGIERTNKFYPDPDLKPGERAELADYARSGYDRGHQAPASDHNNSREAMAATFSLANMAPQRPALNRLSWRILEDCIRSLTKAHGETFVFTGPIVTEGDPAIGRNRVKAPGRFYKVILCRHPDRDEMYAFLMLNAERPLDGTPNEYARPVRSIERLTGLDFFSALPREIQDSLEVAVQPLPPEAMKWRPAAGE